MGVGCVYFLNINDMKISVVIPLYNKRKHIERCIISVLKQNKRPHEVIVVDDGSTDGSAIELEGYLHLITLIKQKNGGESSARNTGISAATGDFIAFLDADDCWEPWFLEKISNLISLYPTGGIYALSYKYVATQYSRPAKIFGIVNSHFHGEINYFRSAAFGDPPVTSSTAVVRKTIFDDVGLFAVGKRLGPDGDMWGRIALKHSVILNNTIGAIYHLDAENRVSRVFKKADIHPFIGTVTDLDLLQLSKEKIRDLGIYVLRLRLNDARRLTLNAEFKRARDICKGEAFHHFFAMRIAWTTRLNYLSYALYQIKKIIDYKS